MSFKKHFRFWLYFHIWISSYLLISDLSRTISRVMSKLQQATVGMIIYLGRLLPAASSNLPKAGGPRQRFCSVLLRMGFTYAPSVTREAVVSYTALPPLPELYPGGIFLLHYPWSRLHRTLSGILPCEARTFLTPINGPRSFVLLKSIICLPAHSASMTPD